jgi:hypothetical protein
VRDLHVSYTQKRPVKEDESREGHHEDKDCGWSETYT